MGGCGSSANDGGDTESSAAAQTSTQWEPVIRCGSSELDVDTTSGRVWLQFVVRDANAINYLTGQVTNKYGGIPSSAAITRGNGSELIVQGYSYPELDISTASDFSRMQNACCDPDHLVWSVGLDHGGMKLIFSESYPHSECSGTIDSEGECSSGWHFVDDEQEIANWWFPGCSGGGGDFTALDASGQVSYFVASAIQNAGGHAAAGHAFDNGAGAPVHRWGGGMVQDLHGGTMGPNIVMQRDNQNAAWFVLGGIRDAYFAAGGATGFLGYPIEAQRGYPDDAHLLQKFEGGYIIREGDQFVAHQGSPPPL